MMMISSDHSPNPRASSLPRPREPRAGGDNFLPRAGRVALGAISRLRSACGELLFPRQCLLCNHNAIGRHHQLCERCACLTERERDVPACPRCGAVAGPHEVKANKCGQCRHRRFRIASLVRVGLYGDTLGHILRSYKYRGREEWSALLARWLCDVVRQAPWLNEVDAVVAVPTHWRHRLGRPVYPAYGLGKAVAQAMGLPALPILRRTRGGPHQVGLRYAQRAANIRGAFAVRRGVVLDGATILLVDDVRTTGATLEECARMLQESGAKRVYAAVLLRVPDSTTS